MNMENNNNDNKNTKNTLNMTTYNKCTYQFTCSNKINCYCIDCQVPYKNWVAVGMYLLRNDICNSSVDETNSSIDETNNSKDEITNGGNFIFKKIILFDKIIYLDDYINNLKQNVLSMFKYDLVYKNNEILIYNINDMECHLTNLLIHTNVFSTEIIKIEIISESSSQFIKLDIYKKLFN